MKKSLNWLLYETHRWLGVVLALFMFFWFFTGIAIMYSTPTTQSRSQQLADEAGTRFYLDPQDGSLLAKLDRSRRVFRWLYSGLHHWDFGWLYHRPIWDAWMLTWVASVWCWVLVRWW